MRIYLWIGLGLVRRSRTLFPTLLLVGFAEGGGRLAEAGRRTGGILGRALGRQFGRSRLDEAAPAPGMIVGLAQGQIVGAGGLADDLARDDELDGGLAGVIAAGDEETEVRMRELQLGRSQRAGGGVAAVAGSDERVAAVVAELAVDAVDLAGDRGQSEAGAGRLPAVEAVAFEGLDDLGLRLEDGGTEAKGERSKQGGLHGGKRGTAQKRGCSLEVERPFQKLPFSRG
ncbi:MAG: hypothetical protein EBY09_15815 [Verrucomicrobia bacterium]|nr:hypothetical protein [Verrucomicrobiota bacterium]